jgi:cell pole-organizing protein PopZ
MAHIVNFSLDAEADRDIIRWLDEQTNRSAAIRAAIRAYMAKEKGVTLADVLAEIRALPSKMTVVGTSSPEAETEGDEPEAPAANLDGLLDRLNGEDWS